MQSWRNAQRRYCAGPRLDRARDASLEHQQNHGAARKQGKSTLWNFFFALFFVLFFLRCFFFAKNHYNGECLKTLPRSNWQDGHKNFLTIFFRNQGSDDEKVRQKITMMASVPKHSPGPKNRIGKKKIGCRNFGLKTARGSPDFFFSETYSGKETRNGNYMDL